VTFGPNLRRVDNEDPLCRRESFLFSEGSPLIFERIDKSIIRDPLTLTPTRPVSIPSQLLRTSSPLRYVASRLFKRPLRLCEAR
jgi:hypothetical protein